MAIFDVNPGTTFLPGHRLEHLFELASMGLFRSFHFCDFKWNIIFFQKCLSFVTIGAILRHIHENLLIVTFLLCFGIDSFSDVFQFLTLSTSDSFCFGCCSLALWSILFLWIFSALFLSISRRRRIVRAATPACIVSFAQICRFILLGLSQHFFFIPTLVIIIVIVSCCLGIAETFGVCLSALEKRLGWIAVICGLVGIDLRHSPLRWSGLLGWCVTISVMQIGCLVSRSQHC